MPLRCAALFGLFFALSAPALAGDAFCDGLQRVIAAAPHDFEDVRGAADAANARSFPHPSVTLAGASNCMVIERASGGHRYRCDFPAASTDARAALEAFETRISDCVGLAVPPFDIGGPLESGPMRASSRGPFRIPLDDADLELGLTVSSDGAGDALTLQIAPPR